MNESYTNEQPVRVTQLPIIEEHLRNAKEMVEQQVSEAMSLVCTPETIQAVKSTRAELNRQFNLLEEQRKAVKAAVMEPYNQFEAVYKECVSEPFKRADTDLKAKASDVENGLKSACEDKLRTYFEELREAYHVDFLRYEQIGITVDMTSAKQKTPKKLMQEIKNFVVRCASDVETIVGMENAEEILAEYRQCLVLSYAISTVNDRHRMIEEAAKAQAEREAAKAREQERIKQVEQFVPPETVQPPEPMLTLAFRVTDTRPRLRLLKQWLDANGYNYT